MEIRPIPAVNGVILNAKGLVLLTRRSPKVRDPGKWCLPGGHLDGGEDWRTAVRRELKEEVGLTVLEEKLLGIYSDPLVTVTQEALPAGFHGQFVVATFLVTRYEGDIVPNDEVDEWGWFNAERLPEPIIRSHPIRIQDAYRFKGEAFIR